MMYGLFWLYKSFILFWGTFWGICKFCCWRIPFGIPLRCFGTPRIIRSRHGSIRLGRGCCLRSARSSNVAGIHSPVQLSTIGKGSLVIGNDVGISGATIVAEESVTIGDRVMLGVNCTICDTDFHPIDPVARFAGERGKTAPVVIGDDVWLGMNVTVLKGVHIGSNSVIGAGSVVTGDIPPNVIAAGNPARVLKSNPHPQAAESDPGIRN